MDRWCEQRMWEAAGTTSHGAEPLCAVSGLAFVVIPFLYPVPKEPPLFIAFKTSFIFLGIGTFVFHWIPNMQQNTVLNVNSFDWFPMVFTTAFLVAIYIYPFYCYFNDYAILALMCIVYAWVNFLLMCMDGATYDYFTLVMDTSFSWGDILNVTLLAPVLALLFCYTLFYYGSRMGMVWFYLVLSLGLWVINTYACERWYVLSVFHALYHVTIAKAVWDVACLGIELLC